MERGQPGDERERALALIKRFGWNATSFQALEPGMRYWFSVDPEACVAYVDTGAAWVAAGAPITASEDLAEAARLFVTAAAERNRRVVFFATERRFAALPGLESAQVGEQATWDPSAWPEVLAQSRSLREQLRRARARGVRVRPAAAEELEPGSYLRGAIQQLVAGWLSSRSLPPMGFLVHLDLFSHVAERRIFVADVEGRLVGFLSMVPVFARGGWLLEDLLRSGAAPNGTSEALVDAAMRAAAEGGSRYATLGMTPLSGTVGRWLRLARRLGSRFYSFRGLRAFRQKFRPARWEPIFISFPPQQNRALAVWDALSAFTPGGMLQFGLLTFARAPELPLYLLAGLLVPWTVLLALAPWRAWFPAPWVQWAWVVFDLLLLVGLWALARRWSFRLATALAVLITGDAALTVLEVILFNAGRAAGLAHWLVLGIAMAGPTLAAAFLWTARRLRPADSGARG